MNLINLRRRLKVTDTVLVRGEKVNQFGLTMLSERVLTPVTRAFSNEAAAKQWFDYSNSELWLYHTGNCKAEQWRQLAAVWKKLYGVSDPSAVVNSAYGHIFKPDKLGGSQWQRARDLLLNDKYTRRAFVQFLLPEFSTSTIDVPCSVIATFKASKRDKRLTETDDCGIDIVYFMRSTDIVYGLPHDIVWAKSLSMRMQMELAKSRGLKEAKLSSTSTVTFISADIHEYLSHPVTNTGVVQTVDMNYVAEFLDFIVFSPTLQKGKKR